MQYGHRRLVDGQAAGLVGLGVLLPQLPAGLGDRAADASSPCSRSTSVQRSAHASPRRQPVTARSHRYIAKSGSSRARRVDQLLHLRDRRRDDLPSTLRWRRRVDRRVRAISPHRRACSSDWRTTVWQIRTVRGDSPRRLQLAVELRRGRSRAATRPCARRARGRTYCRATHSYDSSVLPRPCGASRRATGRAARRMSSAPPRHDGLRRPRRPPARAPVRPPGACPAPSAGGTGVRPTASRPTKTLSRQLALPRCWMCPRMASLLDEVGPSECQQIAKWRKEPLGGQPAGR